MATFKANSMCFVLFGAALGILGNRDTFRRKVSVELNPGLSPPSVLPAGVGLVHVRGLGLNDTLHFLLCNAEAPALLMVHTNSTRSAVKVNWPEFINSSSVGSLKVEPESSVQYSSALVFTRVWEYDDINNTADPQQTAQSSFYPPYELQNFLWSLNVSVNQTDVTVTLCGREKTESFVNGSLCLQVSQWVSSRVNSSGVVGYNQWKPVAYRKPRPVFEDATPCKHSQLVSLNHIPRSGLVQAYFTGHPHTHGLNISFGIAKDPVFYSNSKYITWTVLVGLGEPPADSFSDLIIIIITVGLATPLAIIIVGGVFVWIRKRMSHSSGYEPIN